MKIDYLKKDSQYGDILDIVEETLGSGIVEGPDLEQHDKESILIASEKEKVLGVALVEPLESALKVLEECYFSLAEYCEDLKDMSYLHLLLVRPKYQGRKIGSRLLERVIELSKDRGYKKIVTHSFAPKNVDISYSQILYEKYGFETIKSHDQCFLEVSKQKSNYNCIVCSNPCYCSAKEMLKNL